MPNIKSVFLRCPDKEDGAKFSEIFIGHIRTIESYEGSGVEASGADLIVKEYERGSVELLDLSTMSLIMNRLGMYPDTRVDPTNVRHWLVEHLGGSIVVRVEEKKPEPIAESTSAPGPAPVVAAQEDEEATPERPTLVPRRARPKTPAVDSAASTDDPTNTEPSGDEGSKS